MKRTLALAGLMLLAGCQGQAAQKTEAAAAQAVPSASPSPAVSPAAPVSATSGVTCAADETPIFACKFKDGKRVAVCGAGEGLGRYRFGGATPELELSGGQYAYTMYSGGGEGQIAFENGKTRYIVFSRMVRTGFDENGNRPAISDGIVIERGGKFLDMKLCDDPDVLPVQMDAANAVWEDGRELFTDETMRADPPGDE